jgi:diaminopimelate decarboxylase
VPFTVHPGIGYDIIVNHPLYHGAAIGRAAATDVRVFTASVDQLDGGVHISIGSAIMSPQVFEKAFSAANNLRAAARRPLLTDHYLAIVDLQDGGGWDWSRGEPPSTNPAYYLRFCKSFYRMGGTLDYLRCDNRVFLVQLLRRLGIDP